MTSRISLIAATITLVALLGLAPFGSQAADAVRPRAPGLGDPGQLLEVQIDSGRNVDGGFMLDGQDARQQLKVYYRQACLRPACANSDGQSSTCEPEAQAASC